MPNSDMGALRVPIFIVGAPRSGTTLLRVLLDQHPRIAMWGGESAFFRRLYDRRAAFGDPAVERNRERIVKAYLAIEPVRRLGLDLPQLEQRLLKDGVTWPALFTAMLQHNAVIQGKPHFGEKTPGHAFHVNTLRQWFPDCSIIHIVRDPRDMVSSLIRMPWANRSVVAGARAWSQFNAAAREASGAETYLLVKYENLVAGIEKSLEQICRHIGLAYDPAMLEPKPVTGEIRAPVARAHRPVTLARVGLWRQQNFQPWQVAAIEAAAGTLLTEFGYERTASPANLAGRAKASAEAWVETGLHTASRLPCALFRYLRPTNLNSEEKWIGRAASLYWSVRPRPAGSD